MNLKIFIKRNWDLLLVYFVPMVWVSNFGRIRNFFTSTAAGAGISIIYLVLFTLFLIIIVFVRTFKNNNLNKKRLFWLIPFIFGILFALLLVLLNFDIIDLLK